MQRIWVRSLVQEDSPCQGATKTMLYIYGSPQAQSPCSKIREATMRSSYSAAREQLPLASARESPSAATKTQHTDMAVNFCTMPTNMYNWDIFPKLTAQLKFLKIQVRYRQIASFIHIKDQYQYVIHQYHPQFFKVLQSSEQNYRDIQHTPFLKKKDKKQNSIKQQSSITVVVLGTIFLLAFQSSSGKKKILERCHKNSCDKAQSLLHIIKQVQDILHSQKYDTVLSYLYSISRCNLKDFI